MDVRLNGKPLEEIDSFKYFGLQGEVDVGCASQNDSRVYRVGTSRL